MNLPVKSLLDLFRGYPCGVSRPDTARYGPDLAPGHARVIRLPGRLGNLQNGGCKGGFNQWIGLVGNIFTGNHGFSHEILGVFRWTFSPTNQSIDSIRKSGAYTKCKALRFFKNYFNCFQSEFTWFIQQIEGCHRGIWMVTLTIKTMCQLLDCAQHLGWFPTECQWSGNQGFAGSNS